MSEWGIRWFGASWGAPVCEEENHVDTPTGACLQCNLAINPADQGFLVAFLSPGSQISFVAYHRACFLRTIIGTIYSDPASKRDSLPQDSNYGPCHRDT